MNKIDYNEKQILLHTIAEQGALPKDESFKYVSALDLHLKIVEFTYSSPYMVDEYLIKAFEKSGFRVVVSVLSDA